jgi:hypothetical protein
MSKKETDGRYPYTYSADYIRNIAGYRYDDMLKGTRLSRSDASRIRYNIAKAMGVPDEILAIKLADQFLQDMEDFHPEIAKTIQANLQ